MNPLHLTQWKLLNDENSRSGLFLHFDKRIHPYVRSWLIIYAKWSQNEFEFPVCLNVYCEVGGKLSCSDGSLAYGVMVAPDFRKKATNQDCLWPIAKRCGNY